MMLSKIIRSVLLLSLCVFPLVGRNIILEFKGAYLLPTSSAFKEIYESGSGLFGPEVTVQLLDDNQHWYGFASFDYFHKKGYSTGLSEVTKVSLIPLALGVKYLKPIRNDKIDLYGGFGFQAVDVRTKNYSQFVTSKLSQWGFGVITKVGAFYHLPHNFLLDLFFDYSFAKAGNNGYGCENINDIASVKANVSGAIFGIGLGYNF